MLHVSRNSAYQILSRIYAGCTMAGVETNSDVSYIRWNGTQEQFTNADAQQMVFEEEGKYDRRLMEGYEQN